MGCSYRFFALLVLVVIVTGISGNHSSSKQLTWFGRATQKQQSTSQAASPPQVTDHSGFDSSLSLEERKAHAIDADLQPWALSSRPGDLTGTKREYHWPKYIHQTVKNRSELTCEQLALMRSWTRLNPGYRHIVWDDADILAFVRKRYPRLRHMFESFIRPVERADIFRYLVLHAIGGVYTDTDVECVEPIDTWNAINKHDAAVLTGVEFNNVREGMQLNNWVIASMPHHLALMRVASEARDFIISQFFHLVSKETTMYRSEYDGTVLARTGPKAWTRAVMFYIESVLKLPVERPVMKENMVYGDVRVAPIAWLSLAWGEKCDVAVRKFKAARSHPPEWGHPLACHQYFGSWKGDTFAIQHNKQRTFGCNQSFAHSGPRPEDFELNRELLLGHGRAHGGGAVHGGLNQLSGARTRSGPGAIGSLNSTSGGVFAGVNTGQGGGGAGAQQSQVGGQASVRGNDGLAATVQRLRGVGVGGRGAGGVQNQTLAAGGAGRSVRLQGRRAQGGGG